MKTIRWQMDLAPQQVDVLDNLMRIGGIRTKKELVNNALTILEWALEETAKGNAIASIDKDKNLVAELHMPILSAASRLNQAAAIQAATGAPAETVPDVVLGT